MTTDYRKLFQNDGKVALVTGGARGLGAEIARALASSGAKILVTDVLDTLGRNLVAELQATGAEVDFFKHDVVVEAEWEAAVAHCVARFGRLDILVNNAGIERMQFLTEQSLEGFQKILDVNVFGVFLGCKHAVRAMRPGGAAGKGGSIINISSAAGLVGATALGAYNASKGGVRLLTKSVAVECAQLKTGIRCNSIHPGLIETDMGWHFLQNYVDLGLVRSLEQAQRGCIRAIPMGSLGQPQDIAAAVVFLASEASRYMTGAELVVDGGVTTI